MKWQVEFYKTVQNEEPVKDWLDTFDKKTKSNVLKHFEKLERKKLNLKHPFITHLETQLYEMNVLDEKRVIKIIFFPNSKRKLVMVHGFIKNISRKKINEVSID